MKKVVSNSVFQINEKWLFNNMKLPMKAHFCLNPINPNILQDNTKIYYNIFLRKFI